MRLSKADKQRLSHFLGNQIDRLEAIINDYNDNPSDVEDLAMIKRVVEKLDNDLK